MTDMSDLALARDKSLLKVHVESGSSKRFIIDWQPGGRSQGTLGELLQDCHRENKVRVKFRVSFIIDWIYWTGYAYTVDIISPLPCHR